LLVLSSCKQEEIFEVIYQEIAKEDLEIITEDIEEEIIGIDVVYKRIAVVIFQKGNSSGYYEFYKKDDKIIEGRKVVGTGSVEKIKYVRLGGGTASGDYPFAVIHVINEKMIEDDYTMSLIGDKGSKEVKFFQYAHAIETNEIGKYISYIIKDAEGNVILEDR
jgi:hypothetical protein